MAFSLRYKRELNNAILTLVSMLLLISCGKFDNIKNQLLPPIFTNLQEFELYAKGKDSPFRITTTQREVVFDLCYLPADAVMLNIYKLYEEELSALRSDSTQTTVMINKKIAGIKEKIATEKKIYDNSIYFTLTIGYEDTSKDLLYHAMTQGYENYQQWFNKLSFGLKEYIYLYHDKIGRIPLGLYQMDNTYGMTKERSFLLVFPREFQKQLILDKWGDIWFGIEEFGLKTGKIRLKINDILKTKYKLQYPEVM
ncbi:MAG: hypothetical protein PHR06_05205 [Candidatus Cloacimonetes bacterium]|nr:hypothetical protein [Candidatus Cloacimonadota bacterium]